MTKQRSTAEFDKAFDDGESVIDDLDLSRSIRRVNLDLPEWMIGALDQESDRVGVTRQALIKMWLANRLDLQSHHKNHE